MADTFTYGGVMIRWLGHSSFLIECGEEAIFIDEYRLPENYIKPATIIVHTHGHYDHCVDSKAANNNAVYVGRCRHANDFIGDAKKIREVKIDIVEAYNPAKPFHPKGAGCGVIISIGGIRIYHAGDTDFIPEMHSYKCDVALLPIGGKFTMDEKEAVEAVKAISPKIAIPMHYGSTPMTKADPEFFRKLVEQTAPRTKVVVLG